MNPCKELTRKLDGFLCKEFLLLFAAAFAFTVSPTAHAQGTVETAQVRSLFEESLEFADSEQWEEAADRLERAYQIRPAPVIGYNLAAAIVHLGRFVEASELLNGILRDSEARPEISNRSRELMDSIGDRIGRLEVHLEGGDGEGVILTVDGRQVSAPLIGVPMPIDPGLHDIVLRQDGELIDSTEVFVAEGEAEEVTLVIPPALPVEAEAETIQYDDPPPMESRSRRGLARRWWFWVAISSAVLATSTIVGVSVASASRAEEPLSGTLGTMTVP